MTTNRKHHTKAETFKLAEFTKAHYAESGLNDGEFAAKAAAALGFPVTPRQLAEARDIFDIPNNMVALAEQRKAAKTPAPGGLLARVATLETQLADVLARLAVVENFEFPKAEAKALANGAAAQH